MITFRQRIRSSEPGATLWNTGAARFWPSKRMYSLRSAFAKFPSSVRVK